MLIPQQEYRQWVLPLPHTLELDIAEALFTMFEFTFDSYEFQAWLQIVSEQGDLIVQEPLAYSANKRLIIVNLIDDIKKLKEEKRRMLIVLRKQSEVDTIVLTRSNTNRGRLLERKHTVLLSVLASSRTDRITFRQKSGKGDFDANSRGGLDYRAKISHSEAVENTVVRIRGFQTTTDFGSVVPLEQMTNFKAYQGYFYSRQSSMVQLAYRMPSDPKNHSKLEDELQLDTENLVFEIYFKAVVGPVPTMAKLSVEVFSGDGFEYLENDNKPVVLRAAVGYKIAICMEQQGEPRDYALLTLGCKGKAFIHEIEATQMLELDKYSTLQTQTLHVIGCTVSTRWLQLSVNTSVTVVRDRLHC